MLEGVERLVDLVGPRAERLTGLDEAGLLGAVHKGDLDALARTEGQFAAASRDGITVRMARTLSIPLRYFVAKRAHGPFLIVSDRIDSIFEYCREKGIAWQFHPSYTRMVPANYLVEIDQVGCPDPNPRHRRFFNPEIGGWPEDVTEAGTLYVQALRHEIRAWAEGLKEGEEAGVCFSGGVDSASVFLLAAQAFRDLGRPLSLLRAFTLDLGDGEDCRQAGEAADRFGLKECWEPVRPETDQLDMIEAIGIIEDYHPLDVECAAGMVCLLREVRRLRPALRELIDGDGGDENLKSYPLEDSDLTLQSVLKNPLLYHEGWGVDAIKHSLTYSGGLSRACARGYAPARKFGFRLFSPYLQRSAVAGALRLPFEAMVKGDAERLYSLKGEIVRAGIKAVLGADLPIHPKRRFQDGVGGADPAQWKRGKSWHKLQFEGLWRDRLSSAWSDTMKRVSGNDPADLVVSS